MSEPIQGCGVHGDHPAGECGLPHDAVWTDEDMPGSVPAIIREVHLWPLRLRRLGREIAEAALLAFVERTENRLNWLLCAEFDKVLAPLPRSAWDYRLGKPR